MESLPIVSQLLAFFVSTANKSSNLCDVPKHITNVTNLGTSCETERRSASHNMCSLLWNPNGHYRVHKLLLYIPYRYMDILFLNSMYKKCMFICSLYYEHEMNAYKAGYVCPHDFNRELMEGF